eukprot:COSAG06_NODE_831_length_12041_cov_5.766789_11_plen_134_part_00
MEGEAADKADLFWPGQQENLAKAVKSAAADASSVTVNQDKSQKKKKKKKKKKKPFIVAMAHGSPLISEWAFSNADAVLNIGYGGQAAGYGLIDVLLNEPASAGGASGKLTVTYYKPEQLGSIVDYGTRVQCRI